MGSQDVILRLVIQSDGTRATQSLSAITVEGQKLGPSVQAGAMVANQVMATLTQGVYTALKKSEELAAGIAAAGLALAGIGAAIAAPGVEAIKVCADFERAMFKLQAVSDKGTGSITADMGKMAIRAHELAAATEFSNTEVIAAMTVLRQHGQNTEQVLSTIKPTLDMATTGARWVLLKPPTLPRRLWTHLS